MRTWVVGALRVWGRNFESWKDYARASLIGTVVEPLLFFIAIGYGLGRFVELVGDQPYVAFLAPGLIASTSMNAAAFETTFGAFTRLTEQRTYEAVVMTPISVSELVAGDIFWAASKSVLGGGVILAFMWPLGLVASPLGLLTLPLAFVVGVMFGALGMIWTALSPSYVFFNYFFTLIIGVMFLFGGVFFPLTGLPEWAIWASWSLPLTHAVDLMRALTTGRLEAALWVDVVWVAVFTVVVFRVAIRLIHRRLIR